MASTDKLIRIILKLQDEMSGQLDKASGKLASVGKQLTDVGQKMSIGITAPIVGAGVAMFKTFADFEDVMAEMQARTGATSAEMEQMQKVAIEMGRDTVFSATESAQAMLELTSSGSSAAEAMAQIPDVLNLAAAGALELGTAADGVTDIMKQFQLEVKDTAMITDELTRAAGSSSATVNDLIQGFGNVGPVAAQFGFSVNETSAVLATFAENGIKGAEAGTQLRSMLLNMARDTIPTREAWGKLGISMYDAQGNMRDIDELFKDINRAMEENNFTQKEQNEIAQKLAGSYGIIGFNALRAANGIDGMQASMLNAAGAQEVADARMNTLAGSFKSLMGSVETLGIVLGGLADGPLVAVIKGLTGIVNAIASFAEAHPRIAQMVMIFLALLAAIGPILMIIGGIASGVAALSGAWAAMAGVMAGIPALIAAIGVPIMPLIVAILALANVLRILYLAWEYNVFGIQDKIKSAIESWRVNFAMIGDIISLAKDKIMTGLAAIGQALTNLDWGGAMKNAGIAIIQGLIAGITSMAAQLWQTVTDIANGIAEKVRSAFQIRSPSKVMMKLGEQVGAGFNEGVAAMGGIGVNVPSTNAQTARQFAPAVASGGGGNVYIQNLSVPPGTTQQQVEAIMREIGKAAKRKGAKGLY